MKKDPVVYLKHISACTSKILDYTGSIEQDEFLNAPLVQDAVIRNLEIIGEATKQLKEEFRSKYPDIPWKRIAGLRDKLIHDYISVDLWAVWRLVENVIPKFDQQIRDIIIRESSSQ